MTAPLTRKRWSLLLTALVNYRDHQWETTVIPKGLPQAFHDQLHWYEYYWTKNVLFETISLNLTTSLEDTRTWATPSYNIPLNPFTKTLINEFRYGTDQTWNASHPSGALPPGISPPPLAIPLQAPWPSVTTRIDNSTIQGIMESIHWSPIRFPYFYRNDDENYESTGTGYRRWMDGLYETIVVINSVGSNPTITTTTYTTTLETTELGLVQVFLNPLIHGAKLQWIAQAYTRNLNISCDFDDSQEGITQYAPINPQTSPWGYKVLYEIDINDNGSCYLPYLVSSPFQYTTVRTISTSPSTYSYTESGVSTHEIQHAWVLNLDNAEFI